MYTHRESLRIIEAVANGRTVSRLSSVVQVRPAGSRLHARTRGLGPIGTHIGILLPGLRPVIARFSAISHGRLCAAALSRAAPRRSGRPATVQRGLGARLIAVRVCAIPCYGQKSISGGLQKFQSPVVSRYCQAAIKIITMNGASSLKYYRS